MAGLQLATISLLAANALVIAQEWPLLTVFSVFLVEGLWYFHRLLARRA